jgi:hypothetical protein
MVHNKSNPFPISQQFIDVPFDPLVGMQSAFTTSVITSFDCDELDDLISGISDSNDKSTIVVVPTKTITKLAPIKSEVIELLDDNSCDDLNELNESALKMLIYAGNLDQVEEMGETLHTSSLVLQAPLTAPLSVRIGSGPIGRLLEKRTTGRASNSSGLQIWRTKADSVAATAAATAIAKAEEVANTASDPFIFGMS